MYVPNFVFVNCLKRTLLAFKVMPCLGFPCWSRPCLLSSLIIRIIKKRASLYDFNGGTCRKALLKSRWQPVALTSLFLILSQRFFPQNFRKPWSSCQLRFFASIWIFVELYSPFQQVVFSLLFAAKKASLFAPNFSNFDYC